MLLSYKFFNLLFGTSEDTYRSRIYNKRPFCAATNDREVSRILEELVEMGPYSHTTSYLCNSCHETEGDHVEGHCLFQPSVFEVMRCAICDERLSRTRLLVGDTIELPFNLHICKCRLADILSYRNSDRPVAILRYIIKANKLSPELIAKCEDYVKFNLQ